MDNSLRVEDVVGGLLRHSCSIGQNMGLGRRSDSEAAFQEFLKRIPSATALSSQGCDDSKPMFASASNTSLFGFGSSNLECNGVPRVASLDMLRNMVVDQEAEKSRPNHRPDPAIPFTGTQDGAQSPTSLRHSNPQAQLFQPSGPSASHQPVSIAPSAALAGTTTMPVSGAVGGMALQIPANILAYQSLQQSPHLLTGAAVQALQASNSPASTKPVPVEIQGQNSQCQTMEEQERMEQRRARRMLSNRESARRSRKRKQEQLQDLEQQVKSLEERNESLEQQVQAAAVHAASIITDKQRLENENQHLLSIFQQLEKNLGADVLRRHLPAALGGVGPIPSAAPANDGASQAAAPNGHLHGGILHAQAPKGINTDADNGHAQVKHEPTPAQLSAGANEADALYNLNTMGIKIKQGRDPSVTLAVGNGRGVVSSADGDCHDR